MGIVFIDGRAAIGGRHRTAADGDRAVCAVAKDGLAIRAGGRHRAALHRDRTAAGDGSAVQAARRHRAACDLDFSTVGAAGDGSAICAGGQHRAARDRDRAAGDVINGNFDGFQLAGLAGAAVHYGKRRTRTVYQIDCIHVASGAAAVGNFVAVEVKRQGDAVDVHAGFAEIDVCNDLQLVAGRRRTNRLVERDVAALEGVIVAKQLHRRWINPTHRAAGFGVVGVQVGGCYAGGREVDRIAVCGVFHRAVLNVQYDRGALGRHLGKMNRAGSGTRVRACDFSAAANRNFTGFAIIDGNARCCLQRAALYRNFAGGGV